MINEIIMKKKALILKKPSGTVSICGELTAVQRKFYDGFLFVCKKQLEEDKNKRWFEISLNDLKKILATDEQDKNNKYYKEQIKELHKIQVKYNLLEKDYIVEGYTYLIPDLKIKINKKTEELNIYFALPNMIIEAFTTNNKKMLFAQIDLMIKKNLKSRYALILYDLAKDYKNAEIPKMSIKEFKELFGIENKYKLFPNIRNRVLNPAIKEINNNPNIDFKIDVELFKSGKKYTHIKFHIKRKSKVKEINQNKAIKTENQVVEALILLIPEEHRGKTRGVIKKALEKYPVDYIEAQIKLANNKQDIKDYIAFLRSAIKEDYACFEENKKEIEERKRKQEESKRKAEEYLIKLKKIKRDVEEQARKIIESWSAKEYDERFEEVKKKSIFKDKSLIEGSIMFSIIQEILNKAVEAGKIREDTAREVLRLRD